MKLVARMEVEREGFRLCAELEAEEGTTALVGPSGAGKSTVVRALAGVVRLERGQLSLDGEVWDDPEGGRFVTSERRGVGWMPQDGGLFPHLDALGNVAFPLRAAGIGRRAAKRKAGEWLDRVGLSGRAEARPSGLSGGEARRVALARALAGGPRLLLLDEPFTGLDPGAKADLRRTLREAVEGAPLRLLVAHDPADAFTLADRLVVLESGVVVQAGTPSELSQRPRTPYVAELVGRNLVEGQGRVSGARTVVEFPGGVLQVAERVEGPVVATFRPAAVALFREPPGGSPRNVFAATVSELVTTGERVRVRLDAGFPLVAELTSEAVASLGLAAGERVHAAVKATEIDVLPA